MDEQPGHADACPFPETGEPSATGCDACQRIRDDVSRLRDEHATPAPEELMGTFGWKSRPWVTPGERYQRRRDEDGQSGT